MDDLRQNGTKEIAFVASNNTDIIGYYTAKETINGVALPTDMDTPVWVNLVISINGLKIDRLKFIPMELFQHLKNGINLTTIQLVPSEKPRLTFGVFSPDSNFKYSIDSDFYGRKVAIFIDHETSTRDENITFLPFSHFGFFASNNADIIGYFTNGHGPWSGYRNMATTLDIPTDPRIPVRVKLSFWINGVKWGCDEMNIPIELFQRFKNEIHPGTVELKPMAYVGKIDRQVFG